MFHFYLPVNEASDLGNLSLEAQVSNYKSYLEKKGLHCDVLRNVCDRGIGKAIERFRRGCLRGCTNEDTLFVVLHGLEDTAHLGKFLTDVGQLRRGGDMKKYTSATLARAISKEGLPQSFQDLRLLVCGAGTTSSGGGVFAQGLASQLGHLGYDAIQVTGYKGFVNMDTEGLRVTNLHGDQVAQNDRAVVYGASGNAAPPPADP